MQKQMKEAQKKAQKEKQRLKALPKPLRKLETNLGLHVQFMEVYDGCIGDFTGEIIPAEPVDNSFAVINEMKLNFPHQNSLNNEQKELYVEKISDAFHRMGFYLRSGVSYIHNTDFTKMYELLLFHIENPEKQAFDIFTSGNFTGVSLRIERFDFDSIY